MKRPWIAGWELTTNEKGVEMATLPAQMLRDTLACLENLEKQCNIANVVESKPNEKAALKHAVDVIYFADNSDYLSGLYGVVRSLTGLDEPSEEDIKKLFKELNPE